MIVFIVYRYHTSTEMNLSANDSTVLDAKSLIDFFAESHNALTRPSHNDQNSTNEIAQRLSSLAAATSLSTYLNNRGSSPTQQRQSNNKVNPLDNLQFKGVGGENNRNDKINAPNLGSRSTSSSSNVECNCRKSRCLKL
jgi:hypothetical protein